MRKAALAVVLVLVSVSSGRGVPLPAAAADVLLERYAAGDFDGVVAEVARGVKLSDLLNQLEETAPRWIEAGGAAPERDRRQLVASVLALEAARLGFRESWKIHTPGHGGTGSDVGEYVSWQPPAKLLEWGCALWRAHERPLPLERTWQLAALSVAELIGDPEFLIGPGRRQINNFAEEFIHLRHVRARFPDEPRLQLAEGLLVEWQTFPGIGGQPLRAAKTVYEQLRDDQDVGAEATLRLGQIEARSREDDAAIGRFERVESMTRDPWLLYLARYFKGAALERKRRPVEAERAYRDALAAVPRAQSASLSLSSLLFRSDRRAEASSLVDEMFAAKPTPVDPWRQYITADDRFWPQLITRLRSEIRR
jgi:Flp pilus assembly protein TadD